MRIAIALTLLFTLAGAVRPAGADPNTPITIGATLSLEGRYQDPSRMIQAAYQLWVEQINQKGGLLGRPVRLILYNDESSPERSRRLYKKLIEKDGVDLLFSPYGTPITRAASEVSEAHQMVMLACGASGEIIWERGFEYVFGVYALAKRYMIGLLDLMARQGLSDLALLYDSSSAFNMDVISGIQEWARRFHLKVRYEKGFEDGESGLVAMLKQVKKLAPHGLILSAYPPDGYRLLRQMEAMEYRPPVVGMTIAPTHPDFLEKGGPMAKRVFGPSQWEPDERIPFPGTQKFIESFQAFSGKSPAYHAGTAYAACQIYEQAISTTRTLDQRSLRNYIAALDTVTVIGRFKVDPQGKQIGHNPIIIQWQKGKKEIVWPRKMQTAAPLFSFPGP